MRPVFILFDTVLLFLFFSVSAVASQVCNERSYLVRGSSMYPLIKSGQAISMLEASCEKTNKGDIILFRKSGRKNILVKMQISNVGDIINLQAHRLLLNNSVVLDLNGEILSLTSKEKKLFTLYTNKPLSGVLVLGNKGSFDSRMFGPISPDMIVGKVIQNKSGNE